MNAKKRWTSRKKAGIAAGILALILALVAVFIVLGNQSEFVGNRVKNPDSYRLDCQRMNGTDSHTLFMEKGTVLKVFAEVKKGGVQVSVGMAGEDPVYTSDRLESASFELVISKTGSYVISIDAKHFAGTVYFDGQA